MFSCFESGRELKIAIFNVVGGKMVINCLLGGGLEDDYLKCCEK